MAGKEVAENVVDLANKQIAKIVEDVTTNFMTDDPAEAVAVMSLPIINAENFEDMFLGFGTEPDKELFDIGLHVEGVSFNKTDYQNGLPFYATITGKRLDNGESFITNCGAWQVVLVCYTMLKRGWLPRDLMLHRAENPTAKGYYPVNILPYDAF